MKSCTIPKDYYTGKTKGYAFVNFYSEREAKMAQNNCNDRLFMDKLLNVNFAYEKRNSRSRSRSPSTSSKFDLELQSEIESLLKIKEELLKKNSEIYNECDNLRRELSEHKETKKKLKEELSAFKSEKVIFLPCGHSKLISLQENAMYEDILFHATQYLTGKDAENQIIQKQLKNKIIDILSSKFPESFKCKEKVPFIIGKCGHKILTECYLMMAYKRGEKYVECTKTIEKLLPCGHLQKIECFKELEVVVCKSC